MTDSRQREFDEPSTEAAKGFGSDIRKRDPGEPDPLVEVRGAGEALVVRLSAFQRWLREYDLPGGFILEDPDEISIAPEVKTIIRLDGRT